MSKKIYKITCIKEMFKLGEKIGKRLINKNIVLLNGEIGAGKTTLTKGIALGLDIKKNITSPTFNLLNVYSGKYILYHFDLYRIESHFELEDIGFYQFIKNKGIAVIEWGKNFICHIPGKTIMIEINVKNGLRLVKIEGIKI